LRKDKYPQSDPVAEQFWHQWFQLGPPISEKRKVKFFRLLPSERRCKVCSSPFDGVSARVIKALYGKEASNSNPKYCNVCDQFGKEHIGGAEVDISIVFADVRGSTELAEGMKSIEFKNLINRFFAISTRIFTNRDAFIDKLIGDEVTAIFAPGMAGPNYIRASIECSRELLQTTGHGEPEGPWIPVGIGIQAGSAFVGSVGEQGGITDVTALGDTANTGARLASQAGVGEILVSQAAVKAAGIDPTGFEKRMVHLKGKAEALPIYVITV
jgi:adenylate cyclase